MVEELGIDAHLADTHLAHERPRIESAVRSVLPVEQQLLQQAFATHRTQVEHLCVGIAGLWKVAFDYFSAPAPHPCPRLSPSFRCDDPSQHDAWALHLEPHVSLPDQSLIEQLTRDCQTLHLLLLTARHELGYIYSKAQEWRLRAHDRGYPAGDDLFLHTYDWMLLAARARGHRYITAVPGPTEIDGQREQRGDVPVERFLPVSNLTLLYWQMEQWCKQVYATTVKIAKCERCHAPLPASKGPGRPPKYCEDCRERVKTPQSNARHKRINEEIKKGVREPSPYKQRQKLSRSKEIVTINHD